MWIYLGNMNPNCGGGSSKSKSVETWSHTTCIDICYILEQGRAIISAGSCPCSRELLAARRAWAGWAVSMLHCAGPDLPV